MPNIPEFEAKAADSGLRPAEGGAEAFAGEGRHIEATYARLGEQLGGGVAALGDQWEKHVTVQANLTTMKQQTEKLVARQQEWSAAVAADANAPTHNANLLQDHMAKWAQEDADYAGSMPTQEAKDFASEASVRQQQHFAETGMADMGTLAGHQAVLDYHQHGVYAQSGAYNDPTAGNHLRGETDINLQTAIAALGASGQATPEAINQLRTENQAQKTAITLAQARGTVDHAADVPGQGPGSGIDAATKSFLESPEAKLYLNEQQANEVRGYAQEQIRSKEAQAKAADVTQRRQIEDAGHAAYAQLLMAMRDPKTGAPIPPSPEMMAAVNDFSKKYGAVLPAEVKALTDSVGTSLDHAINHTDVASDPNIYSQLTSKVGNGLTHQDVDVAHARGYLSEKDFHDLHESVERTANDPGRKALAQQTTELFNNVKQQIGQLDNLGMLKGPDADKFYRFQSDVQGAIQSELARGVKPEDIRKDLFDPHSPHYVWGPGQIRYYTTLDKAGLSQAAVDDQKRAAAAAQQAAHPPAAAAPQTTSDGASPRIDISGAVAAAHAAAQPGPAALTADQAAWIKARKGQ